MLTVKCSLYQLLSKVPQDACFQDDLCRWERTGGPGCPWGGGPVLSFFLNGVEGTPIYEHCWFEYYKIRGKTLLKGRINYGCSHGPSTRAQGPKAGPDITQV